VHIIPAAQNKKGLFSINPKREKKEICPLITKQVQRDLAVEHHRKHIRGAGFFAEHIPNKSTSTLRRTVWYTCVTAH
jgi:hypothetical protein